MNQAGAIPGEIHREHEVVVSKHPPRHFIQDAVLALSLANLWWISVWAPLLNVTQHAYWNKLFVSRAMLLALAANLSWMVLLVWLALRIRRRFQNRVLQAFLDLSFLALLLSPLDYLRLTLLGMPLRTLFHHLLHPLPAMGILLLSLLVAWQHRRAAHAAAVAVGLMAPLAIFNLARIVFLLVSGGIGECKAAQFQPTPPLFPAKQDQPRVLWIVFDEADQRLIFEERPPGIELPNLDRFQAESLYATNAFSPSTCTLLSMPALIAGRRVSAVEPRSAFDLDLTLADTGAVTPWSQLPSVFSKARELKLNTALVGWLHPYDRVLRTDLNFCSWQVFAKYDVAREQTFSATFVKQIESLAKFRYYSRRGIRAVDENLRDCQSLATNASYGLTLLHVATPHLPGIYDPVKKKLSPAFQTPQGGYFNNLLLMDRFFGELRKNMEASGLWAKTWVIISSDHSWRYSFLHDQRRDLRVPFLVKNPNSTLRAEYGAQFNTVITSELILAMLRGELKVPETVISWLNAHASTEPTLFDPAEPPEVRSFVERQRHTPSTLLNLKTDGE